jgi:hypothetical protein
MAGRIRQILSLSPPRELELSDRYSGLLLGDSMRNHDHLPPVKEVEHPVVRSFTSESQFVDSIREVLGLRASELVAEVSKCRSLSMLA